MEVTGAGEPTRELFEACRNGDLERVKKLINPDNVNSRDTAGRKSTPLHFAAVHYHMLDVLHHPTLTTHPIHMFSYPR
ncbi:hypothetical protein SKAU_G00150120 [Synaphobranchus kaupii]|uniref:Uncharacterized protein n=1 Tax=Synaphobranchus kaupii TaxID=118154 RepID=A0A9Q1FUM1_SYNKA|nr:hypothetical protein SKAU_G00150120 [Synaphobranchus kaupii]